MIAVNETGFEPTAEKIAVSDRPGVFHIVNDPEGKQTETSVKVTERGYDASAGHNVYLLDLSGLVEPGIYHIESEDGDRSASFKVEEGVYRTLGNALAKFFYFQRCGMELEEKYAGPYSRKACHGYPSKLLYGEMQKLLPKGWHDAGDYGRYVSAGAVAAAHLLYAYELFPDAFKDTVNIPESGNGVPDILNECRYELEFLMSMQADDGGAYHKVTPWVFSGLIMPDEEVCQQLIFPVTSMSTADLAAVLCLASRIYEAYDPSFAAECLKRGRLSGEWLLAHPDNTDFHNPEGCITGEYTDPCDSDERMWAFAELLRTGADQYNKSLAEAFDLYNRSHPHYDGRSEDDGFGWNDVSSLAALSVVFDPDHSAGDDMRESMRALIEERADSFLAMQDEGYPVSMMPEDYIWGSNMVVTNRADVMLLAALIREKDTGEEAAEKYRRAAGRQLHYILGMNAMDISYVTGFGEHAVKDPHNRSNIADGIDRPVPGQMSGGPCTWMADDMIKETASSETPPQKCYRDHHMSYSTNEIAVYWNSSLLFAVAAAISGKK